MTSAIWMPLAPGHAHIMSQLWSQQWLKSLISLASLVVQWLCSCDECTSRRVGTLVGSADWKSIQIDLIVSRESHCPLWYSLTEATFGLDALAHRRLQGFSPSEPACRDTARSGRTESKSCWLRCTGQPGLLGAYAHRDSPSLMNSPEERSSFSGLGHNVVPVPRPL